MPRSTSDPQPDLGDTIVDGVPHGAVVSAKETTEISKDDSSGIHKRAKTVSWGVAEQRRSDPLALLGTRLAGRYELEGVLGTGGMGAVYRARDTKAGVDVAIKILRAELAGNAEAIHRFLREARTTAALVHPNVVRIIDVGLETDSGLIFIVMELLHGETAEAALAQRERFSLHEALTIGASVLRGLAAAHRAGIIHRDLKPANVFLTQNAIKLIDFGIAKSATVSGQISLKLTTPGVVLGTPHYLSPEQARGETNLDPRVDLYALGVVLYELLSGETPFDRPGYMQVLAAICRETAKPIRALVSDVPVEVEAVIAKAMARERDARYANALEMLADIEAILAALPEPRMQSVPEMPSDELVTADIPIGAPLADDEEPAIAETEDAEIEDAETEDEEDVPLGPGSTLQGFPAQAPPPILPTRESPPVMSQREVAVAPPAGGTWIMVAAIALGIAGAVMLIASIWG